MVQRPPRRVPTRAVRTGGGAPGNVVLDVDDDPREAGPLMFGSLLSGGSRAELDVNVWLTSAPGRSATELGRVLGRVAHLVVVPTTGGWQAAGRREQGFRISHATAASSTGSGLR